jgi:protein-S-isoprenylcysteine O-methyltransferase Ste14
MSTKKNENIKSSILTFIQYSALIYLIIFSKWISPNYYLSTIQILGFIVASWAIWEMNKSKINISPTPRKDLVLIKSGPYKLVRHPMYLSLILTLTPAIISYYNILNLAIFIIFLINLFFKMFFEESLLKKYFSNYNIYMKDSWRLIPYIF